MKLADFKRMTLEDRLDYLFEHSIKDPGQRFEDEHDKWHGTFKRDERLVELENRVRAYYALTEHLPNQLAMRHAIELNDWRKAVGYTDAEFRNVKMKHEPQDRKHCRPAGW